MASARPRSRRKQLVVRAGIVSLVLIVAAAAGAILLLRRPSGKYEPGSNLAGITRQLQRNLPEDYPRVRFEDVTEKAGISFRHFAGKRSAQLPEDMGSGAAWGDYDGDGWLDLYLCDIAGPLTASEEDLAAAKGGNRLYRNNGAGGFTDVTAEAGVGFKGQSMAAAWADFDNDGRLDLTTTAYGRIVLYRNLGDGRFEDVSARLGLADHRGFWAGASWSDFDRDGDADLYVCGYVQYEFRPEYAGRASKQYAQLIPFTLNPSSYKPERNLLFRNNGDGSFTETAKQAGVDNPTGRGLAAAWSDFDLDGLPDLYVANDVSDNALYRNRGDGTFEDISHPASAADHRGAMGLAVGDWDNDSDSDIFVTHWIAQENGFYWNMLRSAVSDVSEGKLRFTDVADMLGLGQLSLNDIGWGTSFFDYDNDGQLDLFTANGSTFQRDDDTSILVPMRSRLYWQKNPEDGFFDVSGVSGDAFARERVARGAAFADYDNDGCVDILVVNHQDRPALLKNDCPAVNGWLKVRVEPTRSNRSGYGSVVELSTAAGMQRREIGSQPSYLSQNALEAHFGVGGNQVIDRVRVVFPSGVERLNEDVPANQVLVVEE